MGDSCTTVTEVREPPPLVIVEGFLGGAYGALVWGSFEDYLNWDCATSSRCSRRTIFASVGPVSSLHDRACELYYSLKGGTVDYGHQHSIEHNHSRYGRHYAKGLYPQWSKKHKLHFLGHSIGGPTIMKLQTLLQRGHFGPSGDPDLILSVNAVSSPFRGTQIVYSLGERHDAAPLVRPFSLGSLLAKTVHSISYFAPVIPKALGLDFHADSRSLSFWETSFYSFFRQLWKSDWAESRDAAPFDVTFEAADDREHEQEGLPNATTFYRSHAAYMTSKLEEGDNHHAPGISQIFSLPLFITARDLGMFDFTTIKPTPAFLPNTGSDCSVSHQTDVEKAQPVVDLEAQANLGEEYWANDGVVPLFSQWHPMPCSTVACRHLDSYKSSWNVPEAGVWYVHQVDVTSHLSLIPVWYNTARQKAFWGELGDWLRMIDRVTGQ